MQNPVLDLKLSYKEQDYITCTYMNSHVASPGLDSPSLFLQTDIFLEFT